MGSIVDDKRRQTEMARASGVRTVQIFCGMIMENIISGPHTGVDFSARRRVDIVSPDNGTEPSISFTSSWDVGRAIAAVSTMPAAVIRGDLDQVYISGDTGTWSKLAKLMSAQSHFINAVNFESRFLDSTSPIEFFIRIAAADGQLHFPAQQSSRTRRAVPLNQNHLVDNMSAKGWVKLSQVVRHFDKNDNDNAQAGTSSPEGSSTIIAPTSSSNKRKRDGSDSASVESNAQSSEEEEAQEHAGASTAQTSNNERDPHETEERATSPKLETNKKSKPRSSDTARSTRSSTRIKRATTQQVSAAVLEKRVTRSMTKLISKNDAAASTRRNKRRRVG
ncbi:hypothetical protein ABW20_dc0104086 [Dactylellina cionopaga]|nr:hypothetical protein ABW20_dc0104086 [Dactylellina cionopaga]